MAKRPSPPPLSTAAERARLERIVRIAGDLGFVGKIEYRHVYSQSGGAQYGQAREVKNDELTIFAEAFDRDADSEDFSLEAMIAHERGHQILARHPRIAKLVAGRMSNASEEVLASVIGAILLPSSADEDNLLAKATVELTMGGEKHEKATRQIDQLREIMEQLL